MGDCPESIKSGETCEPASNAGHYVNGISECAAGELKAVECMASSNAEFIALYGR